MNLSKFKISNKGLYWGLIATFTLLYIFVAFVSTLHAIDFFKLANSTGLAVLLGVAYEIGQASVLFSILMTKNKERFLPWALMFLLTALQVTANVYASFKHMSLSGSTDWQFWQKSILFGVQATNAEMYQVIISWISGALLPVVALGMTALVAENIKHASDESEDKPIDKGEEKVQEFLNKEIKTPESIENAEAEMQLDKEIEDLLPQQNIVNAQYDKELLIPDKPKVKKTKKLTVAIPKKAQELLQKEEVKVPEKKHRVSNPLTKKGKKLQVIKRIEQINPTSKGEELIESLKDEVKPTEDSAPIVLSVIEETPPPELVKEFKDSIEVVDVKAVPVKKK